MHLFKQTYCENFKYSVKNYENYNHKEQYSVNVQMYEIEANLD